jgi:hypothetical protein
MRAREFVIEARREKLPPGTRDPLEFAYFLPGIRNNDAYRTYRLGVAMARARANVDPTARDMPAFTPESAFAENAIVAGSEHDPSDIVAQALEMTGYGGGMVNVGSRDSHEPKAVNEKSPVVAFKGYSR